MEVVTPIVAGDGWTLGAIIRRPAGTPRGQVLCLHAMMVDGRTFLRRGGLTDHLVDAGYEVWVPDFRGRGHSGPTPEEGGAWSYDDLVFEDVPAWVGAMRQERPGAFLWVIGHSLGGHVSVAAAAAGVSDADGHVMLSTNIWRPSVEPSRRRVLEKGAWLLGFEAITRARGYYPSRRLRMGPASESKDYVVDLCRFWWNDRWMGRRLVDYTDHAHRVTGPLLSVLGRGDRLMAHPVGGSLWAEALGPDGAEVWVEGKATGLRVDPDHMGLVTDRRVTPAWGRIIRWMARAEAASRSTA